MQAESEKKPAQQQYCYTSTGEEATTLTKYAVIVDCIEFKKKIIIKMSNCIDYCKNGTQ